MIGAIFLSGWRSLLRSKAETLTTFVVPIVFFSIFAVIFGGQGDGPDARAVSIAVVRADDDALALRLVEALDADSAVRVKQREEGAWTRTLLESAVRDGNVSVGLVLPPDLTGAVAGSNASTIELLSDVRDPVGPEIVRGTLQKLSYTALADVFMAESLDRLEPAIGGFSPTQRANVDALVRLIASENAGGSEASSGAAAGAALPVRRVDIEGEKAKAKSMVSYYVAAIAVMFLLFMAAQVGGSLIEEEESGTLERVLSTHLGMDGLLLGKWAFLTTLGCLQIVLMLLWARLAFGMPLVPHLPGALAMTLATAMAASSFGLILATVCRTRGQLSGLSTVVILSMSALGGSMFPRFLMTEGMQSFGRLTFNAWAIDGYVKVFWRDAGIGGIALELGVLCLATVGFFLVARVLARRWEVA